MYCAYGIAAAHIEMMAVFYHFCRMTCACNQVCAALGERARTATAEVPHMFDQDTANNGASSSGAEYWNTRHYSSNHNSTSTTVHSSLQQQHQQHWLDVNVPSPAHDSGIGTFNTDVLDDDDQ
jgi:hypothetical protein